MVLASDAFPIGVSTYDVPPNDDEEVLDAISSPAAAASSPTATASPTMSMASTAPDTIPISVSNVDQIRKHK